jgi:hypothetical protein
VLNSELCLCSGFTYSSCIGLLNQDFGKLPKLLILLKSCLYIIIVDTIIAGFNLIIFLAILIFGFHSSLILDHYLTHPQLLTDKS